MTCPARGRGPDTAVGADAGPCDATRVQVQRIGYASVKGGRHVGREDVDLALTGPVGDRVFCLVDVARNRVVRTVENPCLLRTVSDWRRSVLRVELPATTVQAVPEGTGTVRTVDYWGRLARVEIVAGPWAAAYSGFLGYEVALGRPVAAGEVVYGASVSIVTTGAMRWLSERVGFPVEPERFRSTFVVDTGSGVGRMEDSWIGREVRVGRARLQVRAAVARCAVIDLDPSTGRRRSGSLLRALAGSRGGGPDIRFGVDAVVTTPGRVCLGDTATC